MGKAYSEKLQDKRWKRKRLKILKRDNFKCTACGSDEFLCVHHTRYYYGKEPWQINDKYLLTLCDRCHNEIHMITEIKWYHAPSRSKKNKKSGKAKKKWSMTKSDRKLQQKYDKVLRG